MVLILAIVKNQAPAMQPARLLLDVEENCTAVMENAEILIVFTKQLVFVLQQLLEHAFLRAIAVKFV